MDDLAFILLTGTIVMITLLILYRPFVSLSFDQEFAQVSGIPFRRMNVLFALLVGLVIAMSLKVVGLLLVGALTTLPAASALRLANSFKQLLLFSIIIGELAVLLGVWCAYILDVATGGTIVVAAILILLGVSAWKKRHAFF